MHVRQSFCIRQSMRSIELSAVRQSTTKVCRVSQRHCCSAVVFPLAPSKQLQVVSKHREMNASTFITLAQADNAFSL